MVPGALVAALAILMTPVAATAQLPPGAARVGILKTSKALSLTSPQSLLLRADEVIQ